MSQDLNRDLIKDSVQSDRPNPVFGGWVGWWDGRATAHEGELLAAWGSHVRDRQLRNVYRDPYNWLIQAAVAALTRRVQQTPYILTGPDRTARRFHELIQNADFGAGWDAFISRVLLDFLTCDYGAYIELIGRGKPTSHLKGRVLGIAHLDSLMCYPTGNLEYPVIYQNRQTGMQHLLHHRRVVRVVDMPDGDEYVHGAGLCATSRAVSTAAQLIAMQRYAVGMFRDDPATGITAVKGFTQEQYVDAVQRFKKRRESKQGYTGELVFASMDDISISRVPFSQAPPDFNYQAYIDTMVNVVSATFGIDRQDLFPLSGRMSGTATQSEVLALKANGNMLGMVLRQVERLLNIFILPPSLEFQFRFEDAEADSERANRNSTLANTAVSLLTMGAMSLNQVQAYLASMSDEFKDALNAPAVDIQRPDTDRLPDGDVQLEDDTSGDEVATKDIQQTRQEFEAELITLIATYEGKAPPPEQQQAVLGRLGANIRRTANRTVATAQLRRLIADVGRQAYQDAGAPLDETGKLDVSILLSQQNQYIRPFVDELLNAPMTDAQVRQKVALWFNKSIQPFYNAGKERVDGDVRYVWRLGNTEQHCKTCLGANGQVHRFKDWSARGILPQSSLLECGGWNCDCRLEETTEPVQGSLARLPRHQ